MSETHDKQAAIEQEEARGYFQVGEFNEGMSSLQRAWVWYMQGEQYERSAEIREEQAKRCQRVGMNEQAALFLGKAVEEWELQGNAFGNQGRKSEAIAAYNRALAACVGALVLDPKNATLWRQKKTQVEEKLKKFYW